MNYFLAAIIMVLLCSASPKDEKEHKAEVYHNNKGKGSLERSNARNARDGAFQVGLASNEKTDGSS